MSNPITILFCSFATEPRATRTGLQLKHLAVQSDEYKWPTVFRLAEQWSMITLLRDVATLAADEPQMNIFPPIDGLLIAVQHPTLFSELTRRKMFRAVVALPSSLSIQDGIRLGGQWMAAVAGAREEKVSLSQYWNGTPPNSTDWFALATSL